MFSEAVIGIVLIVVFTNIFKALIEAGGIKSDAPFHDPLIWCFALTFGIAGYIINARIDAPFTGPSFKEACGAGFLAVCSAFGTYHIVTHNYFQDSRTSASPDTTVAKPVQIIDVTPPVLS